MGTKRVVGLQRSAVRVAANTGFELPDLDNILTEDGDNITTETDRPLTEES